MMKLAEAVVFLSLATSLHIGVWAASPASDGVVSGGSRAESSVALAAATPAMTAIARQWQRPLEVTVTPAALPHPAPEPITDATTAPKVPRPDRNHTVTALPKRPEAPALAPSPVAQTDAPARVAAPQTQAPPALATQAIDTTTATRPRTLSAPPAPVTPPDAPVVPHQETAPRADTMPPPAAPVPAVAAPEPAPAAAVRPQPRSKQPGQNATAPARATGQDAAHAAQSQSSNALQAKWGARIQRKVHRSMAYPRAASGSGTARVTLDVDRSGRLVSLRLVRSSGVAAFDAAALEAVKRARRFAKAPKELSEARYSFTLSLTFRP